MIPTGVEFKGDVPAGQDWVGYAKSQLDILLRQMSLARPKPLNEGARVVSPLPGVTVTCISSFGSTQVIIDVAEGRRKPRIVREQKKRKYEYLKLFAHVDMLTVNTWYSKMYSDTHFYQYMEGDILAREQVVSGIGCSIVSLTGAAPSTSAFVTSELLAYSKYGTSWPSVVGGNGLFTDTEINSIIEYYNSLFPPTLDAFIIPDVESADNWYDVQNKTVTDTGCVNTETIGGGMLISETTCDIPAGWCTATYARWSHSYPGDWFDVKTQLKKDICKYVLKENVFDYRCVKYCSLDTTNSDVDPIIKRIIYLLDTPTSGILWYTPTYVFSDREYEDLGSCADLSPKFIRTDDFYDIEEMLEWCDDLENASYPYTYRRMLPYKGRLNLHDNSYNEQPFYLTLFSENKLENYKLPDGFSFAVTRYGGILTNNNRVQDRSGCLSITPETYNISFNTLIKFNLSAGYLDLNPWTHDTYSELHNAASNLVGQVITKLGGTVFDNQTIPVAMNAGELDDAVNYHGFPLIDFKSLPGLLYASPCFNIKIYGIPITEEEYKAVRYADNSN